MTTVQILEHPVTLTGDTRPTAALRLVVTGHAGYGEPGKDIVCAAESILVQGLACALAAMDETVLEDFSVEGVAGSGCAVITATPTPGGFARVRGMFETACMGFLLLARHYPQNVRVLTGADPE